MSVQVSRKYCKNCGCRTKATKQGTSHMLHLLVSVLTVGLWIPFWLLIATLGTAARFSCATCGRKTRLLL